GVRPARREGSDATEATAQPSALSESLSLSRGTLTTIKARTEGRFETELEKELAFCAGKKGSVAMTCRQYKTAEECEGKSPPRLFPGPLICSRKRSTRALSSAEEVLC